MEDSICHHHCGTRPPPLPEQPPIFPRLPLSPSPTLRENEKKKKPMHRKVSHNQYSDEGCCFGAQYNTRVMSSIYRYCNSHELYFIGCTLSDILLSRLLVYVFCSWQDLMHAPACIHIGKKKRSGSITCPYVTRGFPPTQWGGGGNTDESFKKQHNKTFSNQYLYSHSVFSPCLQ